jgi:hypothetical protein
MSISPETAALPTCAARSVYIEELFSCIDFLMSDIFSDGCDVRWYISKKICVTLQIKLFILFKNKSIFLCYFFPEHFAICEART